jgi:phenylacetate-CoA ligase
MRFDFSSLPIRNRAFSETPLTFVDQRSKSFLSAIMDIALIETGNRKAREYWQQKQFQNLLQHAAGRSAFWRKRIGDTRFKDIQLADLPILSRDDLIKQVESEGSLIRANETQTLIEHSTSGSTGRPVRFYQTERNTSYYLARTAACFFMEGRDLSLNRTRFYQSKNTSKRGFVVKKDDGWLDPIQQLLLTGLNKNIEFFRPDIEALCKELERDPVGYLIAMPRLLEEILQEKEAAFLKKVGVAMYISIGEPVPPEMRAAFQSQNIPVRGSYSSEEVGPIGWECELTPGAYHVATSSVVVEMHGSFDMSGANVGKVLVTHLHSYATPFIRYEIGDVATLSDRCVCGHDGPTLSNVHGRTKSLLKHADGRVSLFYLRGHELAKAARFDEYRVTQTNVKTIVVELGGRDSISLDEENRLLDLIRIHAGDGFEITIRPVSAIDWGTRIKRLGFHSEVV